MLCKLRYIYKNIYKDIFLDKYKQSDMVEDYINFLKKIKKLKLYMIKFNKNDIIKLKIYFFNYIVKKKINNQLL